MVHHPDALQRLDRDLRAIVGNRLQALVSYGERSPSTPRGDHSHGHRAEAPVRALAIVEQLTVDDLRSCAERVSGWHDAGLATPLVIGAHEFERALDAFPFEFGAIVANHALVSGRDPFKDLTVDPADLRRACEVQARSHLLHLREGYIETRGRADALADLVVRSAPAFAALLQSIARLQGAGAGSDPQAAGRHAERTLSLPAGVATDVVALADVAEISSDEALRVFPPYLEAVEKLVTYIDTWNR